MESPIDFLVIGSGFGGSVAAMRLAEKGYSVTVLEAGRRWKPSDFPKTNWDLRNFLWAPKLGCTGIQRIRLMNDFLALSGAAVGGGSIVYANVLMEPLKPFYSDPQWADLDDDWEKTLRPHYDTAARMLGVTETPRVWENDEMLKAYTESIGRGEHFRPTRVGVLFGDEPGQPVGDPYFDGEGPDRVTCDYGGGCMIGCRTGGKNTLDKNYLWFAEKYGATVVPETRVTAIRPDGSGGYVVDSRKATSVLGGGEKTWHAKKVVVAAGTLGTLELLHACKQKRYLPYLSDRLGYKFRTNSEVLCGMQAKGKSHDFSQGVAIASYAQVDEHTSIEVVRYNKGSDAMGGLSTLLVEDGTKLTRPLKWLAKVVTSPLDFLRSLWLPGWAKRTVILLVMQVLDNSLHIAYKRSLLRPWKRVLKSEFPEGGLPTFIPEANDASNWLAEKYNGVPMSSYSEVLLNRPITAHVLGGCPMGSGPEKGVVDKYGEVFGHKGLYVTDGAIICANLGVNPSLSITAIAEHVMSAIPKKEDAV